MTELDAKGTRRVRVGVVGAGGWGARVVENFHKIGALAAICEVREEQRALLASRYPDTPVFATVEQMLGEADVAGVVVATPPHLHHPVAAAALRAGRDVLVEKPMTIESREARDLVEMADAGDRILMVGHLLLYHPAYHELHRRIEAGDLGSIRYLHGRRLNLGRVRSVENVLWSFACHDVAVLLHMLDEVPESVSCLGGRFVQPTIDDVAWMTLRYPSGRVAQLQVGWLEPELVRRWTVVGEKACAIVDETAKPQFTLVRQGVDPATLAHARHGIETPELPAEEPLRNEAEHFLECIEQHKTPRSCGLQGLAVVHLLESATTSLRSGGDWVSIDHELLRRPVRASR